MAVSYNPKIVTDALQVHFDPVNVKSYTSDVDSTTLRSIVSSTTGTLYNSVTFDSSDNSFDFDGVDDYIETTYGATTSGTQAYSIAIWIYKQSTGAWTDLTYDGRIIASGQYSGSIGLLRHASTTVRMRVRGLTSGIRNVDVAISAQQWTHIVGTWNGSNTLQIYKNGVLADEDTSATIVGGLDGDGFIIGGAGGFSGAQGTYFAEKLSMMSIYNRVLNASEIKQNFNATRSRFGV